MHDIYNVALAVLIVVDIVYGIVGALINHNFNSNKMKSGLATHTLIFLGLLFVGAYAEDLGQYADYIKAIKLAFIVMYGSSILETYIKLGGKLPEEIANKFTVHNDKDNKEDK